MKRISIVLTVTAVLVAAILLILTIAGAGAVPVQDTAVSPVQLFVNIGNDYVYINSDPNSPVQITVSDSSGSVKATVSGDTNDGGRFASYKSQWLPAHPDILPGDKVIAEVITSTAKIDPVGNITGHVNFNTDTITGIVNAPWFSPTVDVKCLAWDDAAGSGKELELSGINSDNGTFTCDYSTLGFDLQHEHHFEIAYIEPDGDEIQNEPLTPWMRVQYGEDWVGADYPAGHLFTITLKDKDGASKATAKIKSTTSGGWGKAGFQAERDDWTPQNFDIIAGDVVHFASDDGYSNEIKVGTVNGTIDYNANGVSGTILAPWFSGSLAVDCHPWGAPGELPSVQQSSAAADGSSKYECSWDPAAWDIQPGQRIAVGYIEPDDGDFVMNIIADPAPDMDIDKWVPGVSNDVAVGGPAVFQIGYDNYGDAPAQTIWLTDTLPAGATYVADSSGVTPSLSDGKVIWELGPVPPHSREEFFLVVQHSGAVNNTLTNKADIYADHDWDDHDNHAEAAVHVAAGQPDLFVDKWRESQDPTPGGTYLYRIHYGNNGPVPAGRTIISDTLPADTEVVDWYSQNNYDLWQGSVSSGNLVLEVPAIPAQWKDSIMLRLRVAPNVEPGTQLVNKVMIETAGDSDPDNNTAVHNGTWVRDATWDLLVAKESKLGSLMPGGIVNYRVDISNDGNMPVMARLVDTLPAGTTYLETSGYEDPVIENGTVAWDMGEMLPGERQSIHFNLAIGMTVRPNSLLINCAEAIMTGHDDDVPHNNQACVQDTVYAAGPNLRVENRSQWDGEASQRIRYEITADNIGSTSLNDAVIIDTYPEGTIFNGDWSSGWDDLTMKHDAGKREIRWTVPEIKTNEQVGIEFRVDLQAELVGTQGLTFVNKVEAPIPSDVYPDDNVYEQTIYSGGDLTIRKWVSDPYPKPGETAVFTVEFGNATKSHWDAHDIALEDTLPAGLKFVQATAPWDPEEPWEPSDITGSVYTWNLSRLRTGSQLQFDIIVEVEDSVKLGDLLTNEIKIFSTNETDKDPIPANNEDTAVLLIGNPKIYLPFAPAP